MEDKYLRTLDWQHRQWKPSYELINKRNGLREFYMEDDFDKAIFDIARIIDHNHCVKCWKTFSAFKEHEHKGYYSEEEGWLCEECHKEIMG